MGVGRDIGRYFCCIYTTRVRALCAWFKTPAADARAPGAAVDYVKEEEVCRGGGKLAAFSLLASAGFIPRSRSTGLFPVKWFALHSRSSAACVGSGSGLVRVYAFAFGFTRFLHATMQNCTRFAHLFTVWPYSLLRRRVRCIPRPFTLVFFAHPVSAVGYTTTAHSHGCFWFVSFWFDSDSTLLFYDSVHGFTIL